VTGIHVNLRSMSCILQWGSNVLLGYGSDSSVLPFRTERSTRHISITEIDLPSLGNALPNAVEEARGFRKILSLHLQLGASWAEPFSVLVGLVHVWALLWVVLGWSAESAWRGIFGAASDEVMLVTALGVLCMNDLTHIFGCV